MHSITQPRSPSRFRYHTTDRVDRHAFSSSVWQPYARVSWVHEFEPTRDVTASFITVPTAAFTVEGPRAVSDAARVDLGSMLRVSEHMALFATFIGEFSGRSETLAGTGGVRVSW